MTDKTGFGRRDVLRLGGTLALGAFAGGLPTTPTRPAFAQAKALIPAKISNAMGNTTLVLQELLKQQKFDEQLGLDVTQANVGDGTKVMAALINGEYQITTLTGLSQIFPAVEHGAKMKILAGGAVLPLFTVYSAKPEIKSLKDLEGKTVGVSTLGALLHVLMIALFEKKGVDASKVRFVNVGGSAEVFRAASAGTVDAAPSSVEFLEDIAKYGVHTLSDADMWKEIPEYTFQGAFATDQSIAANRDMLVRVLASHAKLYRFLQGPNSKEAWVKAWQTAISGDAATTRKAAESQWETFQKYKPYSVDLTLGEDRIAYLQKLNVTLGQQKTIVPFDQVADMSLARDALKLLG